MLTQVDYKPWPRREAGPRPFFQLYDRFSAERKTMTSLPR